MRDKLETLSAMVDDELDVAAQQTLTDELLANTALKGAWRRYNLFGEVLREEFGSEPHFRVAPREPAVWQHKPERALPRMRLLPIAATIVMTAVGTVAVTNAMRQDSPRFSRGEVATVGAAADPAVGREALPAVAAESPAPRRSQVDATQLSNANSVTMVRYEETELMQHDERLDSYIVNFNEQRMSQGMPGTNPYVRIVGYDAAQ